jgi:hypothetical protein
MLHNARLRARGDIPSWAREPHFQAPTNSPRRRLPIRFGRDDSLVLVVLVRERRAQERIGFRNGAADGTAHRLFRRGTNVVDA